MILVRPLFAMSTGVTVRGYGYAEFRAVAPPEGEGGSFPPMGVRKDR